MGEIENKDQLSPTEVEIRTEFGNKAKSWWEVGVQLPKMQLGMAKTEARISQNYENVWGFGKGMGNEKSLWEKE